MWHWRPRPYFWYLRPTCTYTTMATTIAETSEDTSIFKQKPTRISCVKQSKINVTHLSKRNNTTSASDSSPSRSLSFSPAGKLLRYLHGSYLLPDHNPFFNVLFLWFSSFFICHFSLSVVDLLISILYTQIERSLLSISTRLPILLVGCKCGLGLGQALRSKAFFKNRFVHV